MPAAAGGLGFEETAFSDVFFFFLQMLFKWFFNTNVLKRKKYRSLMFWGVCNMFVGILQAMCACFTHSVFCLALPEKTDKFCRRLGQGSIQIEYEFTAGDPDSERLLEWYEAEEESQDEVKIFLQSSVGLQEECVEE